MVTDRQDPACRSPKNVETPRHLAIIREYSRDQVQGYQVGWPMRMVAPGELTTARARGMPFDTSTAARIPAVAVERENLAAVRTGSP
jgi:hypothetical protein